MTDPLEYVLGTQGKSTYQYVPLLKSLQKLLNKKAVLHKIVKSHSVQYREREEMIVCTDQVKMVSILKVMNFFQII